MVSAEAGVMALHDKEETLSNWFQDHPLTSIISHTFLVAGVTWAGFIFIYDEQKDSNHRAEVSQYQAKVEVLESSIDILKTENSKYQSWLINTPKTIPHLEAQIENEIKLRQKAELALTKLEEASSTTMKYNDKPTKPYFDGITLGQGGSFRDPKTGATIGIHKFNPDFTVNIIINIPGKKNEIVKDVKAGTQWKFKFEGINYILAVRQVNWFSNEANVTVRESNGHNK